MKNKLLILILKEKKIFYLGLVWAFVLFLVYLLLFYIHLYFTSTKLFIRNIPRNDIVTTLNNRESIQSESGFSNPLFNLAQIIQSEELSTRIYKVLQEKYPNDLAKLRIRNKNKWYKKFQKLIGVKIEPSTDIIKVSFKWVNKENTPKVLNEIVKEFKSINLEIKKSVEIKQAKYLDQQVAEIENKLNTVRKQIEDFRLKHKTVDLANESSELIKARVDLQKEAEVLKSDVSYYDKKMIDLSDQLGFSNAKAALRATAIGEDPYLVKLSQDLATAQQNYAKLQARFTDKYPDVAAAKNEITSLKKNIEKRQRESLQNLLVMRGIYDKPSQDIVIEMAKAQAEKISLEARLNTLENGVKNLVNEESKLPGKIFGLERLQKQEEALVIAYTNAKQKQLEAKIKEQEIVDNILPLGEPTYPESLFYIIFVKLFGFLALGFLTSLGIAWVKEGIEDRWKDTKEIEEITGKTVLGIIPWLDSKDSIQEDLNKWPGEIMNNAYRTAATRIINKSYMEEAQAISFISTAISRGKPVIVTNIALALAKLNKSVIIIDANFDEPQKLLREFNLDFESNKNDLIDAISEVNKRLRIRENSENIDFSDILKSAIIQIPIQDEEGEEKAFSYLCANKKVENIYEYVATRGFEEIIKTLKPHYEFILIDTPQKPFIFPEFLAIANASDTVIIISAMNSNRATLIDIINKFEKSKKKILGILARERNTLIEKYHSVKELEGISAV